jgi:hypothetical protein
MAKSAGECFLCGAERKCKRFTFYSGERKGGSRTVLTTATVTVSERWNDVKMHEVHVCRACQERLWQNDVKWPPILCGAGGAVLLLPAVPVAIFGGGIGLAVAGALVVAALAAGGVGAWLYTQGKKPQRARLEELVVEEAMKELPDEDRTFITNDVYIDLVDRGIIG